MMKRAMKTTELDRRLSNLESQGNKFNLPGVGSTLSDIGSHRPRIRCNLQDEPVGICLSRSDRPRSDRSQCNFRNPYIFLGQP